jgi:hypothetical protein
MYVRCLAYDALVTLRAHIIGPLYTYHMGKSKVICRNDLYLVDYFLQSSQIALVDGDRKLTPFNRIRLLDAKRLRED